MKKEQKTKLKTLFTPIKNFFKIVNQQRKDGVLSTYLLDKELDNVNENLPEILKTLDNSIDE